MMVDIVSARNAQADCAMTDSDFSDVSDDEGDEIWSDEDGDDFDVVSVSSSECEVIRCDGCYNTRQHEHCL